MISQSEPLQLTVGGAVNARTGVYVVRPCDEQLLELLKRGEYCNVLSSRQVGKTSLIKRTRWLLWQEGYHTAEVEVAGYLGSPTDASEWYQGLLDGIADQLKLDVDVEAWWQASRAITANQKLIQFFREEVIAKRGGDKPVIIFLDEIDSTLALKYTDDFFVAIRAMYSDRASDPLYEKIAFCLSGVATPNELIKERRTTPYNIGKTIELPDFDPDRDDLTPLYRAACPADEAKGEKIVRDILAETGGHPYLTARVLEPVGGGGQAADIAAAVRRQFASLDEVKSDTHFDTMLRFINERVDDKRSTLELYRDVLRGKPRVPDQTTPAHLNLKLIGLVKRDRRGNLVARNPVYARLFDDEWAEGAMPPVEQRVLVVQRRAVVARWLALIALVLLLIGVPGTLYFTSSTKRRIINKAKQGQLVTPSGESAYDLFTKGKLSEKDLADIRQEVTPILESRGNEVIRQITNDGYNPPADEVSETAKLYSWLNQLVPNNAHEAREHYFQGRVAYERTDWKRAENEFQQAIKLEPTWALPLNTLARLFMRRKDYATARAFYERAIQLDQHWIFPRMNLCVLANENLKDYSLGERACRDVLQLDPNKAAAYYYLGRALEGQGKRCGAYEQYRLASEKAASTTNPGFNVSRLNTVISQLARQCGER